MPQGQLTGTRIREKRIAKRVRQADLALRVGISASYLNLIEHNKLNSLVLLAAFK
ncbi:MAG: helix-turn-helix domain-containing protein, partial [Lutimaribacter sp.]